MMGINKGYLTAGRDAASDECLTPRYAVLPLVKYLLAKNFKTVWCPFDNQNSFYVRVLQAAGFKVIFSHIDVDYDFFKYEPDHYDVIVSNPPFSIKDAILERLYALEKPFAMLLPQNSLQSQKRTSMFIGGGLEYLGFDKRVNFYINGVLSGWKEGNHFAVGYFCKNVLPEKLMFEILDPVQEPYFSIEEMVG